MMVGGGPIIRLWIFRPLPALADAGDLASVVRVASACFGGASMGRYDTNDPATRIGYVIADVFLVLFIAYMFWGLFFSR